MPKYNISVYNNLDELCFACDNYAELGMFFGRTAESISQHFARNLKYIHKNNIKYTVIRERRATNAENKI